MAAAHLYQKSICLCFGQTFGALGSWKSAKNCTKADISFSSHVPLLVHAVEALEDVSFKVESEIKVTYFYANVLRSEVSQEYNKVNSYLFRSIVAKHKRLPRCPCSASCTVLRRLVWRVACWGPQRPLVLFWHMLNRSNRMITYKLQNKIAKVDHK